MKNGGLIMIINNIEIPLYSGDIKYNNPLINERRVELALCEYFCNKYKNSNMVEVGCVTPYYWDSNHIVVDLFDGHNRCIKKDIFDFNFLGYNVLSISTIEHVGSNDYGEYVDNKKLAFESLNKIINESDKYLITFPIGYNKFLDKEIFNSKLNFIILKRDSINNWEVDFEKNKDYEYGFPFNNANAIFVITNIEEFFN
jgi:hypothetical protein